MVAIDIESDPYENDRPKFRPKILRHFFGPAPLFIMQPVLSKIVRHIAKTRPELFERIGPHKDKLFLIDPTNLPFVFALKAHPHTPSFKAYRRHKAPKTDAKIAGTFLTLLDMVDGRLDGDALFFTRALSIEGDTEAVVCLRNAIDDIDGSIAEDAASLFGFTGRNAFKLLRKVRQHGQ